MQQHYGDKPPCVDTIRRWIRHGYISTTVVPTVSRAIPVKIYTLNISCYPN
ncbi:hypothetical protein NMD70_08390 [Edwardsiella tarda]